MGKRDEGGDAAVPSHGDLTPTRSLAHRRALLERSPRQRAARRGWRTCSRQEQALGRQCRRMRAAALFLLRLPAQQLDPWCPRAARALAGIGCHFMVQWMDRDTAALHPDGRRGRVLARRGAVQHAAAHLPEHRRRHLLPFGLAGDPRRDRIRRQHHLQDPLQRRGRHDRRPADGDRQSRRAADHPRSSRPRACARSSSSPTSPTSTRWAPASPPASQVHHRDELDAVQRALREVAGRHGPGLRPDLCRREAPPPQARRVPDPDRARGDQRAGLRGLRRLRRRQSTASRSSRVETEFGRKRRDRPVRLQQGLLLPQGLLPELRHGARAASSRKRERVPATCRSRSCRSRELPALDGPTASSSPASAAPAWSRSAALLGMAAHLEGKGVAALDMIGPGPEGRRRPQPPASIAPTPGRDRRAPRRGRRRPPGARLRHRRGRRPAGARDHAPGRRPRAVVNLDADA